MKRKPTIAFWLPFIIALTMASGWAFFLPIFLNPDEDSHYDYALTMFSAGRPMRADEHVVGRDTHPVVEYLMRETHAREQRLDLNVGAPRGYGTATYFHELDARAPHASLSASINPAPYISRLYPIGYYALAAAAVAIGDTASHHSAVAQFFSARILSIALLVPTLWFTWQMLVELRLVRRRVSAIFACVALMPLTAWMFASVQPDVLVCALVAPITYVSLRWRNAPAESKHLIVLGFLLAALAATKLHYFAAMYLPIAAMLAARLPWRSMPRSAAFAIGSISIPPVLAIVGTGRFLHTTEVVTGICQSPSGLSVALKEGAGATAQFFALGLQRGLRGTFLDVSGSSFWLNYTAYRNTPLDIISHPFSSALTLILQALSVVMAILFVVRVYRIGRGIFNVAIRRSWRTAATIATSNILVNSLLTFIFIIYGFQLYVGGDIPMQGRYWLPFLPAIWLVTFTIAPRALPRRLSIPVARVAFVLVFGFATLASAYTFSSLHERFYDTHPNDSPSNEFTSAIWADVSNDVVRINGVAYDLRLASPVEEIEVRIDGRKRFAPVRFDRPDVQCDMEKTLLHVGYRLRIAATSFAPGSHRVDVFVRTPWHHELIDTGTNAIFTI